MNPIVRWKEPSPPGGTPSARAPRARRASAAGVVVIALACVAVPVAAGAQGSAALPEAVAPFVAVHAPVVALAHVQVIDGTGLRGVQL